MNKIKFVIIFLALCLLTACHSNNKNQKPQFFTVNRTSNIRHLYYSAAVKPIRKDLIISPANGIINQMNFHYGDFISKGDLLFTIHSPGMENEFRNAISNYLRMKQSYLNSKKNIIGTELLYKEKIISEQEYENEKSQYQNSILGFVEANNKLKHFLFYLPSYQQKIMEISFFNLDEAKKLLERNIEDISIFAQATGIILFPEEKNLENLKQLQVGSEIKQDEVLLEIGDLTGLSITVNISENDINLLKPGTPAILTFQSDYELELRGNIVSVAKQAKNSENTGFSIFPVVIHVPNLTYKQMQKIRVGMNAKVDIILEQPSSLKLPISAITQRNGHDFVKKLDRKTGKLVDVEVNTGITFQNEVSINQGLNEGDKVVIND